MIIKLNENINEDIGIKVEHLAEEVLNDLELSVEDCHRDLNCNTVFRKDFESALRRNDVDLSFTYVVTPSGFKVGGNALGISWDMMYALFDHCYNEVEMTSEQLTTVLKNPGDIRCFKTYRGEVLRVKPESLLTVMPGTETTYHGIGSASSVKEHKTVVRMDAEGDILVDSYTLTRD